MKKIKEPASEEPDAVFQLKLMLVITAQTAQKMKTMQVFFLKMIVQRQTVIIKEVMNLLTTMVNKEKTRIKVNKV